MLAFIPLLSALALAAPTKRANTPTSGTISVGGASSGVYVSAADNNGIYTIGSVAAPFSVSGNCSANTQFSINGINAVVSSQILRSGPSVTQLLAVHVAQQGVRFAQYYLGLAIAFESVQSIRKNDAATISNIRHSNYDDAAATLAKEQEGWTKPYTESQNYTILHYFDNAQGAATEGYKADYKSCVAAKAAVVASNVTMTQSESVAQPFYLAESYPADQAALADKVAKIAAAYMDYDCTNYSAIVNNSLSPASTDVHYNQTVFDFNLAQSLTLVAATNLQLANDQLTAATQSADVDTSAYTNFTSAATTQTNIFSVADCTSSVLSVLYTNTDGTQTNGSFFALGGHLEFSGNVSAASGSSNTLTLTYNF